MPIHHRPIRRTVHQRPLPSSETPLLPALPSTLPHRQRLHRHGARIQQALAEMRMPGDDIHKIGVADPEQRL